MEKLHIDKLGINGEGIGRLNGKVVFTDNALPEEIVEVEILKDSKKFSIGKTVNIVEKSKNRIEPPCPYFFECGGCVLQHLNYKKTLEYKSQKIKETLKSIVGVDFEVDNAIPSNKEYGYRNKNVFPVVFEDGKTKIGMFKEGTHELIEIDKCLLANETINEVLKIAKEFIKEFNIKGFNYKTYKGDLKYVVVRNENNQTIICLVLTREIKEISSFVDKIKHIQNVGLYININKLKNSIIMSDKFKHIYGIKRINLEEFGIKYSVDISSFLQVNSYIKQQIYSLVLKNVLGVVLDAFAGAGLMSAIIAKKADYVYSVEFVKSATESCKELIRENQINNLEAINGDCDVVIPMLAKKINDKITAVLDPAKRGCGESILTVKQIANKIVYISCNPIALAKDLKELLNDFDVESITPFDMFPQTKNVETVVVLNRKAIDK